MSTEWVCSNQYVKLSKNCPRRLETMEHPLKQAVTLIESKGTRAFSSAVSNTSSRTSSTLSLIDPLGFDGLSDPLSQFAAIANQDQSPSDPLSRIVSEYEAFPNVANTKSSRRQKRESIDSPNWNSKRLEILNKFTTSEKLTITSSFLSGGEMIRAQTTVSDKVKYRLEQLDDFEEGSIRHMQNLTQYEYISRIEQLNHELVHSWNNDQRVKALKIVIQCSKMLSDTSVLQFYPSQFVLITDILDIFGKLVYTRLKAKADVCDPGKNLGHLPERFTPDMVPESTKETCQNWFYKIASIRELLPRLYVEMAILKCYSFLTQTEFNLALLRLTRMIRGIGDPLISTYARCYLVRVGLGLSTDKEYIKENIKDFLTSYEIIFNGSIRSEINRQRIDITSYLALYEPALNWILTGLVYKSDLYADEIIGICKDKKNNGPLLNAILIAFKPDFVAIRALDFVKILSQSNSEGITKGQLFRSLGLNLCHTPPPTMDQRSAVYIEAFKTINTFVNSSEYMNSVEVWSQYVAEYFTLEEINIFLGEVYSRIHQNKAYEPHYNQLQSIIDKIVAYCKDFESLLTLDNFLPVLDLFKSDSIKLQVCKNIMTAYKNSSELKSSSDPVVTNALMYLCKVLNDSVNSLTVEDERRQIGLLISNFIQKIDYGQDIERELAFYVDARGAFPNLDTVIVTLVQCVNKLSIKSRLIKKHSTFVKATAAYCFITIPSIVSICTQMDLYLLSGQVALQNGCLGQADAFFEAALNLVAELPSTIEIEGKLKSTETYLVSYLCNMLSTLIVVPDSPDKGVLYLLRVLLDTLKKYPFDLNSSGPILVYLHALDMLYVQTLETFPYNLPNVVSNDGLYGSDPKFIAEVNSLCSEVADQILVQLKLLGDSNQQKAQTDLALEFFIRVVRYTDLNKDKLFLLACNLWGLIMKNEQYCDLKILRNYCKLVEEIKIANGGSSYGKRIEDLIAKMKSKM